MHNAQNDTLPDTLTPNPVTRSEVRRFLRRFEELPRAQRVVAFQIVARAVRPEAWEAAILYAEVALEREEADAEG